jgi:hypothetical protein
VDYFFDFKKEFIFIAVRSAVIDIIFYLISVLFYGFTLSFLFGLILGTASMLLNFRLLYLSVIKNTKLKRTVRNPMMKGYLLRMLIASCTISLSFFLSFINPLATLIPFFYPKLIYTAYSIVKGGK